MPETKRTLLERIDATTKKILARADPAADIQIIKQEIIVANAALAQLITQFDTETNAISARIDALIAKLGDSATPEQIAELQSLSDRLTTLGQDPNNPVPAPVPPPTT